MQRAVDTKTMPAVATLGDTAQMTPPTSPPPTSGLESLIEKAKEDLAQRLSISVAQISLIEAREVVWPDASLGCPQPGMRYKQVPEDGALIILQDEGISYEYHSGGRRGLFLCEKVYKDPKMSPKLDVNNLTPPIPDNSIPRGEEQ